MLRMELEQTKLAASTTSARLQALAHTAHPVKGGLRPQPGPSWIWPCSHAHAVATLSQAQDRKLAESMSAKGREVKELQAAPQPHSSSEGTLSAALCRRLSWRRRRLHWQRRRLQAAPFAVPQQARADAVDIAGESSTDQGSAGQGRAASPLARTQARTMAASDESECD